MHAYIHTYIHYIYTHIYTRIYKHESKEKREKERKRNEFFFFFLLCSFLYIQWPKVIFYFLICHFQKIINFKERSLLIMFIIFLTLWTSHNNMIAYWVTEATSRHNLIFFTYCYYLRKFAKIPFHAVYSLHNNYDLLPRSMRPGLSFSNLFSQNFLQMRGCWKQNGNKETKHGKYFN